MTIYKRLVCGWARIYCRHINTMHTQYFELKSGRGRTQYKDQIILRGALLAARNAALQTRAVIQSGACCGHISRWQL